MIEELFTGLTMALSGRFTMALIASFGWGIMSILLSPCHMASIPLIIGYISRQGEIRAERTFKLALLFAIGILVTIALTGMITASMGRLMGDLGTWGNYLVAAIFILIGLYLMDIIRWDWNSFNPGKKQRRGLTGAFILGLLFGLGLGPCTFAFLAPVLGVVFHTAADHWLKGVLLISLFGIGHCTVIVAAGSLTNLVQRYVDWSGSNRAVIYLRRLSGFLVLCGGIYFLYQYVFNR